MSIIIVGGGMTGATLALAISRLTAGKLPVHLIEAVAPQGMAHPGFDARAIALADGTCQQLTRLGIWPAIADCATAIRQVHVSDRGHCGFVTLKAQDYRIPALGQVVELHDIGRRLFSLLEHAPGVTLHCPEKVVSVERRQEGVTVSLSAGQRLEGSLLVAADGAGSSLGAECGITWQRHDYQQLAVIANVATSQPHQGRAFERFTDTGPLAMLPMSNGRCSLVWCLPLANRHEIAAWHEAEFCQRLQQAFGWRLGRITQVGARHHYPLKLTVANNIIAHRTVVVGNAAQALHPIAGQGFNLALRDVISLAENLATAALAGRDPGDYATLVAYQQQRSEDKRMTIGLTHSLARLFANSWWPLVIGRNMGLMALDNIDPARDALAERTLGWVAR